jgi:hypothetical protein
MLSEGGMGGMAGGLLGNQARAHTPALNRFSYYAQHVTSLWAYAAAVCLLTISWFYRKMRRLHRKRRKNGPAAGDCARHDETCTGPDRSGMPCREWQGLAASAAAGWEAAAGLAASMSVS